MVVIDGADTNGAEEGVMAAVGGGPLGALARGQYGALARLRWRLFLNGLRSNQGALELGARTVSFAFYAVLGLGLGVGLGAGAFALASNEMWQFLPILFWALFFLWQVMPVALASFQEQFDLAGMLRFPVSFSSFYLLYVVFGLADTSTVLGGLCCLGIWTGIAMARPELFLWTGLSLAGFATFNILLVRSVLAWIDRWLAQRRTREIVGALFMVLLLSVQLLNPAFHEKRNHQPGREQEQPEKYSRMGTALMKWLPPGLAGVATGRAARQQPWPALGSLGVLGMWVLAAGGLLAVRIRAEYRGENLGDAPGRAKAAAKGNSLARREGNWVGDGGGLLGGSGPIAAVMEKELRTVLRSPPLLYAVGGPLVMVLIISGLLRGGGSGNPFPLALPVCVAYALLGFMQLMFNNLGAEGAGIQLLFLSPTPIRTVLLAKNLFHAGLFGLAAVLAGILTSLRLGRPDGMVMAATLAWALFALPVNLAAGNVFSLAMPHRLNLGRMMRQRGSQASNLLSLLIQLGLLGVSAGVFWLCWFVDRPWLAVPIFLVAAVAAVRVWLRGLENADDLANRRRESLIATLMKTE
jgi:ABC-2 type transport system permease protein